MSSNNWRDVRLADITEKITKGTTPTTIGASFEDVGINYIKSECITASRILDRSKYVFISEDTHKKLKRSQILTNDILFSMAGMFLGKTGIAFEQDTPANTNQAVAIIRIKNNIADYKYIYYYLNQEKVQSYINGSSAQSAQPNINLKQIGDLNISIPVIVEQKAIAATLSCLDDMIELNNRTNEVLEEMAQAIFKRWFFDFEFPNENGEPYKSSGGDMIDSELGEIPKGWEITSLGEICKKITDGSHFSPANSAIGIYPMLSVKDMDQYGFNYNSCKMISSEDFEAMVASDCVPMIDDILVAKDGSYLKHIFIVNNKRKEAILSSIAIFRPDPRIILPELLLCLLKNPTIQQTIKDNFVSGSALPRIVLKDFKKLKLVLPPIYEQVKVSDILSGVRNQLAVNQAEINILNHIRDTLLPKLMSGEIRVPVEEVI